VAQVLRRRGRIQMKLDAKEREALLGIVEQFGARLGGTLATTPRAYEESELQAEYHRWVWPDVERGRDTDLQVVRDCLAAGEDTLPLTEAQALSWLRAFNHLRVAAGEMLGIDADGWEERADATQRRKPEFGVLVALGWIQEELVAALDS
jgi:hypothetical protein